MNANQEIIAELRRVLEERDQARRERDQEREACAMYAERSGRFAEQADKLQRERDLYLRERDLAVERLKNEIKAANQARMAEERARESLDELDAAVDDCLPGDDDDSPLDCVERAADRLRELARERDLARREADRFRHGCTVEGDFVCPNEYAVSELTAERNFLRALKKNHEEDFTRVCKERDEARSERDSDKLTAMAASMAHDSIEKMIRFELRVGPEDSLHEAVQRVRYERDEALAEVERLNAVLSSVTAENQDRAQREARALQDWQALRAERDEARANYQWMVNRACDEKLDGYRELGAKCAQLEQERDEAQEAYREARASRWHVSKKWDEALKEIERLRTENEDMGRALNEARAEVEKLSESAKAAWEAECVMREQRDRYHAELKQQRQEVERLRTALLEVQTSESAPAWFADGFHDGWKAGAEAMRGACAAALMADGLVLSRERAANVVRALPIPEEP